MDIDDIENRAARERLLMDSDEESLTAEESGYSSDDSHVEVIHRAVPEYQRVVLSPLTIVCATYCYYTTNDNARSTYLCMSCTINPREVNLGSTVYVIRRHEVDTWDGIRGLCKDKLRIVRSEFAHLSTDDFDLLTRKGVFPYEYVDCAEKLEDTRLPSRESFYSSLTGNTVSESDYAHAVSVWQRFAIRTLGEYSDLYLKTDVLLLADVFENFRDSCINSYGLDPAYYYILSGFTWDAMLKHTRINFELLTDIDMTMCQPLPYANFRWVDDTSNFDVNAIAPDSPKGYVLEVDLEYPQHLHDAHADLPFCPMRDKPPGSRQDKLLATLHDKKRKTMENVRNHVDVKLLTKWNGRYGAKAMIAKPNFHSRSVFSENLVAIEMRKLEVKFNKPIYVGMCILDISK
ncbi:hypothetical protein DMN91_003392, partial [Ooceraea biroi]